jgi:hypothetical protein
MNIKAAFPDLHLLPITVHRIEPKGAGDDLINGIEFFNT